MRRVLLKVGHFQSSLLLCLIYLVLWVPVGLLSFLFADWLRRRRPAASAWLPRNPRLNLPEHAKEPY